MRNLKINKNSLFYRGLWLAACHTIGGQAIMEGIMMRNFNQYALAVRDPDGHIHSECHPWRSLSRGRWLGLPFLRGFPILLETMWNGIGALNRSVELAGGESAPASRWQAFLSIFLAILFALALFVIAPHLLSLAMLMLGLGGDVDGLDFHLWDGFFKTVIFICYIWLISLIPDIRRVFEYHGAEHKTIHAYEQDRLDNLANVAAMSRMHPRCGTTFLLFVIVLSIILQALAVPFFIRVASFEGIMATHAATLAFKLLLVAPISALAYELIRYAARLPEGIVSFFLQAPGLALQRLTTREPARDQLEVAVRALSLATRPDGMG